MNRIDRRLTSATMMIALLGAGFLAQNADAADAAGPALKVVQLETVYITGKRLSAEPIRVVQLPNVVVIGKRLVAEPVRVVQLPTVTITGKRLTERTLLAQKSERSQAAKTGA